MSLLPARTGAAAVLAIVLLLGAAPAAAERPSTTTTTTSSTSTTTTSSTTSTTTPGTTTTTTVGTPGSATGTSTTSTTPAPGLVPADVQAMIDAYPRTLPGSTRELVVALSGLPALAARAGFGRFPVAGAATWSHDWLFPRHAPSFHVHEGTDVFAARGTPVQSPAAGTVRVATGAVGGLSVTVVQHDGTSWYLAHLDTSTVADGDRVEPGTTVGTVGDSGNAAGGAAHVHIEVRPLGGEPKDPKPYLDAYLAEALAAAPALVDDYARHARWSADRLEPLTRVEPVVLGGESCPLPGDAGR